MNDRRFEAGKINLAECSLVHSGVNLLTVEFLAVRGVMFDTGCDLLALNALDGWSNHLCNVKGIFTVVLEVPAADRRANNI